MTYEKWLTNWLEYYIKPTVKYKTYEKYKQQINQHIAEQLGNIQLNKLNAELLQKYVVGLNKKGLSFNSINGIITILKSSLKCAVKIGKTDREYTSMIRRPKSSEKRVECLTREEQKKLEIYTQGAKKSSLKGIIICLYTGLRIGELLSLKWDDVDFKQRYISVTKTCRDSWQNGKYKKIIDTPKTESSQRRVPIAQPLIVMLREMKKISNSNYVINGKTVEGAELRVYQKSFERVLKKLEISHKGFHCLRHTFATRALECGMDVKTLSELLGHKSSSITLKRYAHSLPEHKQEMIDKLTKLLM